MVSYIFLIEISISVVFIVCFIIFSCFLMSEISIMTDFIRTNTEIYEQSCLLCEWWRNGLNNGQFYLCEITWEHLEETMERTYKNLTQLHKQTQKRSVKL